jgi:L-ascorbate metabolism protein UlaG (beta-lactamase superfamily)
VSSRAHRGLDAVLISHAHYDHLDVPSLERLGKKLPVVVPRGLGGLLRKKRFESVLEVEVGETIAIGALQVRAVPAEHDRGRMPFGASADPVGYVISGSSSIYFAGDTDLFDGMSALGPVDLGLIPIWGWGPGLGGGHLDPARAAEAAARIRPRLVVPIHWGTYFPLHLGLRKQPAFIDVPPLEFVAAMKETAPDVEVKVLRPGDDLDL